MTGPAGFWCRHCGKYQSIRTKPQLRAARSHVTTCNVRTVGDDTEQRP